MLDTTLRKQTQKNVNKTLHHPLHATAGKDEPNREKRKAKIPHRRYSSKTQSGKSQKYDKSEVFSEYFGFLHR